MSWQQTSSRKADHLDLCLTKEVSSETHSGWDTLRLPHRACPELNFTDVDVSATFLGQRFPTPFLISSMTGGSREGDVLNERLAEFAEHARVPMGVGSQRIALENRELKAFALRQVAPRATLLANIGAVQLNYGVGRDELLFLVDQLQAQALILHLNPLQECIQEEGDRNFSNLLSKIESLAQDFPVPLIVKETGCGLDSVTARRLAEAGIAALDVAGMGGTHWGLIEGLRSESRRELGLLFRDWGLPTAQALKDVCAARSTWTQKPVLVASGGVRHGLDAAKALALGADMVGMALPFLKAAKAGPSALEQFFETQTQALKVALFCTGSKNFEALRQSVSFDNVRMQP